MHRAYRHSSLAAPAGCCSSTSLRVLREYERGVVFQLGRFWRVKGPGLVILIPGDPADGARRPAHRRDGRADAGRDLARQRVGQGQRGAVLPRRRSGEGGDPGRELPRRDQPARADDACARCSASTSSTRCWPSASGSTSTCRRSSTAQTDAWGIKVTNVEIKHVDLERTMIRAIARQAEAERERRAKVIHAEGELQASEKLAQAAEMLARQPQAMQLRYLRDADGDRRRQELDDRVPAADGHRRAAARGHQATARVGRPLSAPARHPRMQCAATIRVCATSTHSASASCDEALRRDAKRRMRVARGRHDDVEGAQRHVGIDAQRPRQAERADAADRMARSPQAPRPRRASSPWRRSGPCTCGCRGAPRRP